MARSLARPSTFPDQTNPPFYHKPSDRYYALVRKNGRFFQRRHQIGPGGEEINVLEKEIHYVVGSGRHAQTFLHRAEDGRLTELPLAWYAAKGGFWEMNPGFDIPDHPDFRREIPLECVFCHTAYPRIRPGSDKIGSVARFPAGLPEGIDCQRCHGPGRRHIEAAAGTDKEAIRKAIVNPARLPPERRMEVCMQCHLETTSALLPHAIQRYGRGVFSFRPGEPLGDYAIHFDHAAGFGKDDKFEIAHESYRLRKSLCFQKSGGNLSCITCHDPHGGGAKNYTRICQSCHPAAHNPPDQTCTGCHMPKRRTDDVVHAAVTDHRIQRVPEPDRPNRYREHYRGPVVLYYPERLPQSPENEIYQAVAQVKQFANLKEGIPRLAALLDQHQPTTGIPYFELAEAYAESGDWPAAIARFRQAAAKSPEFAPARIGLGRALLRSGRAQDALAALEGTSAWNLIGLAHLQLNQPSKAAEAFRREPHLPDAWNNLAGLQQDPARAIEYYREAIRLQPDLASAQRNLAKLLAAGGKFQLAEYHFQRAIAHNPKYAAAHLDYGVALAGSERFDQAAQQFRTAISIDPTLAEAHCNLADMIALRDGAAAAIPHYQQALLIKPDLGIAHLGMGSALASLNRVQDAKAHLRQAAVSQDPSVRQEAAQLLQFLR